MPRATSTRSGGFSLVELIILMIVIAIMAATVMLRLSAATEHSVTTDADQLRRNLSHIQALALGWGVRLKVSVTDGGKSYTVTCRSVKAPPCTAVGSVAVDPSTGNNFIVALSNGVGLVAASGDLYFDSLGRPASGDSVTSLIDAARTYTLTGGSRPPVTVAVQPITGFATTSY